MQVSANSVLMLVSVILYSGSNHLKQCGNLVNINPHVGVMPMNDQGQSITSSQSGVKIRPAVSQGTTLRGHSKFALRLPHCMLTQKMQFSSR